MKTKIDIQDSFVVADGVALVLRKMVSVNADQVADALRGLVCSDVNVDDAGGDWFYDESKGEVFITDPDWVVSTKPLHVQLLKTADMLDGRDFSAGGSLFARNRVNAEFYKNSLEDAAARGSAPHEQ